MKVAVIGGGISGISAARILQDQGHKVSVFEKQETVGGLLRCKELPQGLYHLLGGHVFNTKTPSVKEWFWSFFEKDSEFRSCQRNADIWIKQQLVGYPIENFIYKLEDQTASQIISEILQLKDKKQTTHANFHDFLLNTFGKTLCELYFFPYNKKLWRCDLREIPVDWLEGKLPSPSAQEIMMSNILRQREDKMVHANFFYPQRGGSQFTVERLAKGLEIKKTAPVRKIEKTLEGWQLDIARGENFDAVIYTGDVRELDQVWDGAKAFEQIDQIKELKTRGISNVFCECDKTDATWRYIPDEEFSANRIIYTGALSPHNNAQTDRMTCVVEFVYGEDPANIQKDLQNLPGNLCEIDRNHVRDAYVIQQPNTRKTIGALQEYVNKQGLYLCGRFAQWEYFNADKAMESAQQITQKIEEKVLA